MTTFLGYRRDETRPNRLIPIPPPQCARPSDDVRKAMLEQLGEDPTQARRCWGCTNYQPRDHLGTVGTCRLRPPLPRRGIAPAGFPETKGWWWCRRFEPHEETTARAG